MKKTVIIIILLITLISAAYAQTVDELLKEADYLRQKGFQNAAIAVYHRARKKAPNNLTVIKKFADYMVEVRNYAYAIILYKKYLEINPDALEIREMILDIYTSLDQYQDAGLQAKIILKKDPDNYKTLSKLQNIYKSNHQLDEELVLTEKLLKLRPNDDKIYTRLIEIYNIFGAYKKAAVLMDKKKPPKNIPQVTIARIYLEAHRFDRAIEMFKENYEKNPTEENKALIRKAELIKINYRLENRPRAFNMYFSTLRDIRKKYPNDEEIMELDRTIRKDVQGFYTGYEYVGGKSGENKYYNHTGQVHYPVLSTGTNLILTGQEYRIWNDKENQKYSQLGLEIQQNLGGGFLLAGAYRSGDPGDTYFGQLYYQGDKFEASALYRKDYQLQTPEALKREISYNGLNSFVSFSPINKLSLYGRYASFNYSDDNNGTYREVGAFYRLWQNKKNAWFDIAVANSNQKFDFESPYYYSPSDVTQWHGLGELNYFLSKNTLLRLSYQHAWDKDNNKYDIFYGYLDHQFSKDMFLYGEYYSGLSTVGRMGTVEDPTSQDYEFKMGVKVKF